MKKYLIIIIVGLVGLLGLTGWKLRKSMEECDRLRGNQESLMQEVRLYENKLGESVASVGSLRLTKDELEKNYKAVCEEARALGVKVKRLERVSQSTTTLTIDTVAVVRDSIVWRDRPDTVQAFAWRDPPWAIVNGVIDSGRVSLNIQTTDSLVQIVHRVPKKFLFFRFGTKAIRQEVVSKNPYARVVYTEYIELTK